MLLYLCHFDVSFKRSVLTSSEKRVPARPIRRKLPQHWIALIARVVNGPENKDLEEKPALLQTRSSLMTAETKERRTDRATSLPGEVRTCIGVAALISGQTHAVSAIKHHPTLPGHTRPKFEPNSKRDGNQIWQD